MRYIAALLSTLLDYACLFPRPAIDGMFLEGMWRARWCVLGHCLPPATLAPLRLIDRVFIFWKI